MKAAKITVAGTTYFLVMDGEAMFTIRDIYGGTRLMLDKMEQDTREGFLETCNAAAILAERGELVRRRLGYEPGRIPERDDFALLTQPYEIVPLKRAIANAIKLGYGREITAPGDDEVDEGLEELNQKKTRFAARTITEEPFCAAFHRLMRCLCRRGKCLTCGNCTLSHTVKATTGRVTDGNAHNINEIAA